MLARDGESDGALTNHVGDDGVGINGDRRGNGITNMGDRVSAIGGTLEVEGRPGGGTVIRCVLPMTGPPA